MKLPLYRRPDDNTSLWRIAVPSDLKRNLTIAQTDKDQSLWHIGLVGDTYTTTVTGDLLRNTFIEPYPT